MKSRRHPSGHPASATDAPGVGPAPGARWAADAQAALGNQAVQGILRSAAGEPTGDPASAFASATRGPGGPIPYREEMEAAFGRDFSAVRAHLGQRDPMAALGARAAARGRDIAFATTNPDRELVAHELAHVVQQEAGPATQSKPLLSTPGDAAEREADDVASAVVSTGSAPEIRQAPTGEVAGDWPPGGGGQADDVAGGVGGVLEVEGFLRELYNRMDAAIAREIDYFRSQGVPDEVIARWAVQARNEAKAKVRRWDVLRTWAEQRNLARYGDELGPSYPQLRAGDPGRGIPPRTDAEIIEGATRTNPRVTRWAGRLRIAGRILILIDIGVSAYRIVNAPTEDRPKVFIREATGFAGALAGAYLGGEVGAWAGGAIGTWFAGVGAAPGAALGALVGGIGGALAGAFGGARVGDWLVEELYPPSETRFEEGR